MTARPHVERYFVYAHHWRPNVSCDACNWIVQGLYEQSRAEQSSVAEAHLARLVAADERAKIAREPDV